MHPKRSLFLFRGKCNILAIISSLGVMVFLITCAKGALETSRHALRYSLMDSIVPAISDSLIFGSMLDCFTHFQVSSDLLLNALFLHLLPLSPNQGCISTNDGIGRLLASGSCELSLRLYALCQKSHWHSCRLAFSQQNRCHQHSCQ